MTHPAYPAILERFLQLEDYPYEITEYDLLSWGITTEMVPDLIETILDAQYYYDSESPPYPHLYAYIALGQIKTPEAIDGLILGVKKWAHGSWFEWFCEGMPDIFGEIGSIAIPALIELLQDKNLGLDPRSNAISYLHAISIDNPEERDRCVAATVNILAEFADNDPELNGFIIMSLVADFNAVEAVPTIEAAYAADRVALEFIGDWEDVQVHFGLISERITPKRNYLMSGNFSAEDLALDKAFARQSSQIDDIITAQKNQFKISNDKTKAKRKDQKKSRKKNRRK
jgi:HEAT repeat protein